MAETPNKWSRRAVAGWLVLMALALWPYLGGVGHDFVYDDHGQIVGEAFLQSVGRWRAVLTLDTLGDPTLVNGRRPAVLISYMVDHSIWGDRASGWRVTNYLWLLTAMSLLYALIPRCARRLLEPTPVGLFAFTAAWLFVWHPALIESVQVPAFRPDLMVLVFVLLTIHAVMGLARERPVGLRVVWGGLGLVTMAAALLSKESGVMAPAVVLACWWLFPRMRPGWVTGGVWIGGAVAVIGIFGWLSASAGAEAGVASSWQAIGSEWNGRSLRFPENVWTMPWLWLSYLRVLVLPYPLIVDRVVVPVSSLWDWRFGVGMLVVAGTAAWGCWPRFHRRPWLRFGLAWLVLGFAPVSNAIPLLNPMAERYMPPLVLGYALMLAWLLVGEGLRNSPWGWLRSALLAMLLATYMSVGVFRVADFRDDPTLWSATLRNEPRSARAHTWAGILRQREGDDRAAERYFERARVLNPRDLTPIINLAILRGGAGKLDEAEELLRSAIAIRPSFAPAHWNLAQALMFARRMPEAMPSVEETLRLDPYHVPARRVRARWRFVQGDLAGARADTVRWLELAPGDEEARSFLAAIERRSESVNPSGEFPTQDE